MSNKNQKHPLCACAHTPSAVAIGMVIPLELYYQPKAKRKITLEDCADFDTREDMIGVLNQHLLNTPEFEGVPPYASTKLPYKICPETDAEELVYIADQEKSLIEVLGKHEEPLWGERVQAFKSWYKPAWQKDQWTWSEGC